MTNIPRDLSVIKNQRNDLPSLTENTFLRYLSFAILYVAQGIPEGMTFFGIPAWMAMNGKSALEIGGFVGVMGLPWSFKIIIAPFMDRFTFLPMGRRRPWVIVGQLGLIVSFIAMSLVPDPLNQLKLLMLTGFFISFFGALQDVAVDGMAIDTVPVHQQARANGLMWGAKTIGISASLVAGTWMIHQFGFASAIRFLSVVVGLILLVPLLIRERAGEKILPWTKGVASLMAEKMQLGSFRQIFKSLFMVFFLPNSLLMGVGVFFLLIGCGLMDTLFPVFTIQVVNWTNQDYSQVLSVIKMTAGFLGIFVGGALSDLFGKRRMMTIYLVCMIILVMGMASLKSFWNSGILITAFIGIYNTLYVFLTIAIFAAGMELCWKRVAATQFTLYMAISNLGKATGAAILGPLREVLAWEYVILSFAGFAIVMLVLIQFLHFTNHLKRLELLESDHPFVRQDLPS